MNSSLIGPLFIMGVGRSGTSLLQSMLNAHSQIAFTPETHFIRHYLTQKQSLASCQGQLLQDKYLQDLNIDLEAVVNQADSVQDVYVKVLESYRAAKKKHFIGDKDPKNIEALKTIQYYFPHALIIHIYRDPRAVIASRLKASWSKDRPFWQHLLAYKAQINYIQRCQDLLGNNLVTICYEQLLSQPQAQLNKILSKLDLAFEESMIEFFKQSSELVRDEEKSWKSSLTKPLDQSSAGKWQEVLTQPQIQAIERALYPEMHWLGYQYSHSSYCKSGYFSLLSAIYRQFKCY